MGSNTRSVVLPRCSRIDRSDCSCGYSSLALLFVHLADGKEVKVFKYGVGKKMIEMADETQFKFPDAPNFDDEVLKKVDFSDEYDELVPRLPRYEVHKHGKNLGYTLVPIVTRPKPFWSTPSPRLIHEKPWPTPDALKGITRQSWRPTPPTNSRVEELLPEPPTGIRPGVEDLQPKHRLSNNRRTEATSAPKSGEEEPQISLVTKTPANRLPSAGFRRITIATTTPESPASSARTRPVWHHPQFWATSSQPPRSQSVESEERRPLEAEKKPKVPSSVQVSSLLEASESEKPPSIIHRVDSKMIEERTGGKRIFSTASDGTPVEIIMAPPTPRTVAVHRGSDSTVRSNSFKLIPEANGASPSTSAPGRQFTAWSRQWSWSVGPDGKRTEVASANGKPAGPNVIGRLFSTTPTAPTRRLPPPIIQTTANRYKGPSFNCRVLEAISDGQPAADNDPDCKLLYPGYPLDNSCKCHFHVNGRDENGCAKGFLFTCQKSNSEFVE
ncbi:hypothetical protein M3Y99_00022600 [Aphelenchoides fujianensis]|nr:hypothetical protein M3Y99_00022600 [Aphelenchoides fujianensis]